MLPQTTEQSGVASRVSEVGAGIKVDKLNGALILNVINEILKDDKYKKNAIKISEGFKRCSGAKGAADKIIEVICEN